MVTEMIRTSRIAPGTVLVDPSGTPHAVARIEPYDGMLPDLILGIAVCSDGYRQAVTREGHVRVMSPPSAPNPEESR